MGLTYKQVCLQGPAVWYEVVGPWTRGGPSTARNREWGPIDTRAALGREVSRELDEAAIGNIEVSVGEKGDPSIDARDFD